MEWKDIAKIKVASPLKYLWEKSDLSAMESDFELFLSSKLQSHVCIFMCGAVIIWQLDITRKKT